jgi:hypothetical protein
VWHITFQHELSPGEGIDRANLMREVEGLHLTLASDVISWTLEPSGKFSVKSLYRKLCMGDPQKHFADLWKLSEPLNV